jgi:hypothetical protein
MVQAGLGAGNSSFGAWAKDPFARAKARATVRIDRIVFGLISIPATIP